MTAHVSAADRAHAAAMAAAGALTIAYWTDYFTRGAVRSSDDRAYIEFENAFPLADGYMAACYFASALLLRRGKAAAVPTGIAAGSAMVFLGAMDTLWNIQHGNYRRMNAEMWVETIINAASLTFGPYTMARLWRRRHAISG